MPIVDLAKRDARLGALGEHIWVERIYSDFAARISPMPALQLYPIRPGASIWKGDFVYVDLDGFVHREMRPGTCDSDIKDFPPSPGILVAVAAEDSPSGRLARHFCPLGGRDCAGDRRAS
jgi:hypothetical protein